MTHDELWAMCKKLPQDYEPYGDEKERIGDCSGSCVWFHTLSGEARMDWGVCGNKRSHRYGLLTFEHQGCHYAEQQRAEQHHAEQQRRKCITAYWPGRPGDDTDQAILAIIAEHNAVSVGAGTFLMSNPPERDRQFTVAASQTTAITAALDRLGVNYDIRDED